MVRSSFRVILLAGAAAVGIGGLTHVASATSTITATAGDFQVIESCDPGFDGGCSGTFNVINNSGGDGDWYVYAFQVSNPFVVSDATTQTNWDANLCTGSCTGNEDQFKYNNRNFASSAAGDLANDVGPGQSSNLFTFNSLVPNSPVTLDLVDQNGDPTTVSIEATEAPEPASLAVLGSGLLGLFGFVRRRRSR